MVSNPHRVTSAVSRAAARLKLVAALSASVALTFGCNEALVSLLPPTGPGDAGASAPTGPGDGGTLDAKTGLDPVSEWPLDVDAIDVRSGNNGMLLGGAMFAQDAVRGR